MNGLGYLIFMTLPIIWLLGLLPPFEVLLLWIIEQTQIIIFGGTSSVKLLKTFIQFGISVIQTVIGKKHALNSCWFWYYAIFKISRNTESIFNLIKYFFPYSSIVFDQWNKDNH